MSIRLPAQTGQQDGNLKAATDNAIATTLARAHEALEASWYLEPVIEYRGKPISRVREGWEAAVKTAGLETNNPRMKIVVHSLRHTSISWYLASGVDIESVSQFAGVSPATIRKVCRHALPGTFKPVLALQLPFVMSSESMGDHDSGSDDWRRVG